MKPGRHAATAAAQRLYERFNPDNTRHISIGSARTGGTDEAPEYSLHVYISKSEDKLLKDRPEIFEGYPVKYVVGAVAFASPAR